MKFMKSIHCIGLFALLSKQAWSLSVVDPVSIHSIHDVVSIAPHVIINHHSNTIASASTATIVVQPPPSSNLLDLYKHTLAEHPLYTKMVTGGTLAVTGDAIAQSKAQDEEYSKRRALSFMVFDMCYRALQHYSFPLIVGQCHGQYLGGAIASVPFFASVFNNMNLDNPEYYYGAMEQTLASQLGIVPFLYYPVFYVLTAFVQGLDTEGAINRAKETFIPLMKRNLLFWIPVQFVQFGFIEESLQIPFLAVCGLVWTFIISLFAGNAKKSYSKDDDEIAASTITVNSASFQEHTTSAHSTTHSTTSSYYEHKQTNGKKDSTEKELVAR